MRSRRHAVVIGGGMVAHRFVEALRDRDCEDSWRVTVLAEEPRAPYDRAALTSYFRGRDPRDLQLGDPGLWQDPRVTLRRGHQVTQIDRSARTVTTERGLTVGYDALVVATGSHAFTPPVPGAELPGVFVYRTIDDVAALRIWVEQRGAALGRTVQGVVVGGGLLGLEAAGALQALGARSTVVECAPRLMPLQVDEAGGQALARLIRGLGVDVRTSTTTAKLHAGPGGHVGRVALTEGAPLDADVVVFATGVRPRDELVRAAGLSVGERGGIVVDESCRSVDDENVWGIGEVASLGGRCLGLVAPGYTMAEIVVDRLLGGTATFPGADLSTKLKLLGVDVASFGDAFAETAGALEVVHSDPVAGVYRKLVLTNDAKVLLGGILIGDVTAYASLRPLVGRELGCDPAVHLIPEGHGRCASAGRVPGAPTRSRTDVETSGVPAAR